LLVLVTFIALKILRSCEEEKSTFLSSVGKSATRKFSWSSPSCSEDKPPNNANEGEGDVRQTGGGDKKDGLFRVGDKVYVTVKKGWAKDRSIRGRIVRNKDIKTPPGHYWVQLSPDSLTACRLGFPPNMRLRVVESALSRMHSKDYDSEETGNRSGSREDDAEDDAIANMEDSENQSNYFPQSIIFSTRSGLAPSLEDTVLRVIKKRVTSKERYYTRREIRKELKAKCAVNVHLSAQIRDWFESIFRFVSTKTQL